MARYSPEKRAAILAFIRAHYAEHGYAPTCAEIAAALNMSETNVVYHLQRLRAGGYVEAKKRCGHRTIVVTEKGMSENLCDL